jgi:hypothetical protein
MLRTSTQKAKIGVSTKRAWGFVSRRENVGQWFLGKSECRLDDKPAKGDFKVGDIVVQDNPAGLVNPMQVIYTVHSMDAGNSIAFRSEKTRFMSFTQLVVKLNDNESGCEVEFSVWNEPANNIGRIFIHPMSKTMMFITNLLPLAVNSPPRKLRNALEKRS